MMRKSTYSTQSRAITLLICIAISTLAPAVGFAEATATPPIKGEFDLIVYSGTPSGVMGAVAAGRAGQKVLVVEPRTRIGGMISGGLTKTDIGTPKTIGGLTREFFDRVLNHYKETNGPDSRQVILATGGNRFDTGYFFEPSVGQHVMEEMLTEAGVQTVVNRRIVDAVLEGTTICAIIVEDPRTGERERYDAKMFIDSGYEGDLMAHAAVPYRVGREARSEYGESGAGINMGHAESIGVADHRIQAYNYRVTITNRPDLVVPFPKPEHYDPAPFASYVARINAKQIKTFHELFDLGTTTMELMHGGVNGKFDFNRCDLAGVNYAYPDGSYAERASIDKVVRENYQSFLYMLQNDPRLSEEFRRDAMNWGLPKDEHVDSGHFPDQIYLREGRRMIGRYVLTQHDVDFNREKPDVICQGSYNMDCHQVQTVGFNNGMHSEGHFNFSTDDYAIPYRSITPADHPNLLVTSCISATHVAYSSVRMEPVYMMMGEAAGHAAFLARSGNTNVQSVNVPELQSRLQKSGIPLEVQYRPMVAITSDAGDQIAAGTKVHFGIDELNVEGGISKVWWNFDGSGAVQSTELNPSYTFDVEKAHQISLLVEDAAGRQSRVIPKTIRVGAKPVEDVELDFDFPQVKATGPWLLSRYAGAYWRRTWHDLGEGKGAKKVVYRPDLPRSGRYLVAVAYHPQPKHADNVEYSVQHADGDAKVVVDQRTAETPFPLKPLGVFRFEKGQGGAIEVSNAGTKAGELVIANNIRWIWLGDETDAEREPEKLSRKDLSPTSTTSANDLPRVVLLGDSIRIGYLPTVASRLQGRATVLAPESNCRDSDHLLKHLREWAIDEQPDVVVFNCGIHDSKQTIATGECQVPLDRYERNLRAIVEQLRASTTAEIVFATTTPILDDAALQFRADRSYRLSNATVEQYNVVARKLMDEFNVPVVDLHQSVSDHSTPPVLNPIIGKDGVHMTKMGRQLLGDRVAEAIAAALKERQPH